MTVASGLLGGKGLRSEGPAAVASVGTGSISLSSSKVA